MKVIAINGSGRKDGNTAILIKTIFAELEKEGLETELIQLWDKNIKGCKGCFACFKHKNQRCIQNDDLNAVLEKVFAADGIILGSPVYFADVSGQMKAFMDRAGLVSMGNGGLLKHKVAASVVAVRRGGAMHAVDSLNHFFLCGQTFLVGSTYWNMVYGREIGDVLGDEEGMTNMRNLGQNMAWLLKRVGNE